MQFTKQMIELVYEIRRFVPSDLKPSIKLANPELFDELKSYYHGNKSNAVTKALIKELFYLAGGDWPELLRVVEAPQPKQSVKVYRGQTIFEDRSMSSEERSAQVKKRVYRGQVVMG